MLGGTASTADKDLALKAFARVLLFNGDYSIGIYSIVVTVLLGYTDLLKYLCKGINIAKSVIH